MRIYIVKKKCQGVRYLAQRGTIIAAVVVAYNNGNVKVAVDGGART